MEHINKNCHIVSLQQERTVYLAGKTEKIEKQSLQLAEKSAERSTVTIEYSCYQQFIGECNR